MSYVERLALRVSEAIKDCWTQPLMPRVWLAAGLVIPGKAEGLSSIERALALLETETLRELDRVTRWLGVHWTDSSLRESGIADLEKGKQPIGKITACKIAKCFGDDQSSEHGVLQTVLRIFPDDKLNADFVVGRFPIGASFDRQLSQFILGAYRQCTRLSL
jgi:hypothetical protein